MRGQGLDRVGHSAAARRVGGVLFALIALLIIAVGTSTRVAHADDSKKTFTIRPGQDWKGTGFNLKKGDSYSVTARVSNVPSKGTTCNPAGYYFIGIPDYWAIKGRTDTVAAHLQDVGGGGTFTALSDGPLEIAATRTYEAIDPTASSIDCEYEITVSVAGPIAGGTQVTPQPKGTPDPGEAAVFSSLDSQIKRNYVVGGITGGLAVGLALWAFGPALLRFGQGLLTTAPEGTAAAAAAAAPTAAEAAAGVDALAGLLMQGKNIMPLLMELAKTAGGRALIRAMHLAASGAIAAAVSTQEANILTTIQQMTGQFGL
jgi:hypothetical protein